ncbi:MAG: hypothetical protein IPL99_11570 [Candidatus Competibacteraceae bacterium]|nr:hypothetical protein [Candidatus Competibacteraceae bacterium]
MALHRIVPSRWLIDSPQHRVWTSFLDQPMWRWFGIVAVLAPASPSFCCVFASSRYWGQSITIGQALGGFAAAAQPGDRDAGRGVDSLPKSCGFRAIVYAAVTPSLWTLYFLALTWMVWAVGVRWRKA